MNPKANEDGYADLTLDLDSQPRGSNRVNASAIELVDHPTDHGMVSA